MQPMATETEKETKTETKRHREMAKFAYQKSKRGRPEGQNLVVAQRMH